MAGRGMGAATRGGGAVRSGPRNKVMKTRSKTTGIPMYAKGGDVKEPVKKNMGGGIGAGINASLGRMNSGINRRVAAMPKQGAPSSMRAPRGPMPSMSTNKSGAKAGLAAQNAVRRAAPMMVKGGPVKKKKK